MSDLRSKTIRLANSMPKGSQERKALLDVLARGFGLSRMKDKGKLSLESGGVYAHVWFDMGVARTDFGRKEPNSGEWEVIISTSSDPLNMKPRGKELARNTFRYADPQMRGGSMGMAEDFINNSLSRYRGR